MRVVNNLSNQILFSQFILFPLFFLDLFAGTQTSTNLITVSTFGFCLGDGLPILQDDLFD
jgi:hypothetical protein